MEVDAHGKMPDAVIYGEERDWLFLIEPELFMNHKDLSACGTHRQARRHKESIGLELCARLP